MMKVFTNKAHYIGPFLFLVLLLSPLNLEQDQKTFLAIFSWVVANWLFTSIPLAISGLMGVAVSIFTGVTSAKNAFAPLSSPTIYLFLGGFLFARAMNASNLDRRISLTILSSKFIQGSFSRMILALLLLTAVFSMWVSNTATTAMMLPIVLGTLTNLKIEDKKLIAIILLATAYASSIGGLATPIGSPPNIIAISMLQNMAKINITFLEWMAFALPLTIIFFGIIYWMTKKHFPKDLGEINNEFITQQLHRLPAISREEKTIMLLFALMVLSWFGPSLVSIIDPESSTTLGKIAQKLDPGAVGVFFAGLLFVLPLNYKKKILIQDDLKMIDWNALILFGTGISLGKLLFDTGLAKLAGDAIIYQLAGGSIFLLFFVLIFFTIFFTELASNTATSNILLPIVLAMSLELGLPPLLLAMATALSCSLAFALPVATPPNAIVYGTGMVDIKDMIKAGMKLNLIFGTLMVILFYFLSLIL